MVEDKSYLLLQIPELYEATLDEFSQKEFSLASTNEIIKLAGYNKGSFYYRFKTKEELYFALIDYIYTRQIALFRSMSIDLNKVKSLETLLYILWDNLGQLVQEDERFYQLLRQVHSEKEFARRQVKENCITSLFERFNVAISNMIEQEEPTRKNLILDTIEHYYYDFPYDFDDRELKNKIRELNSYILHFKMTESRITNEKKLILEHLNQSISFVLIQNETMEIVGNPIRLAMLLSDEKQLQIDIRNVLKIRQITLNHVIQSGIQRNLRDFSHLLAFQSFPYYDTSYHQLKFHEKIVLLMVYASLIGSETIVMDYLLKFVEHKYLSLLFIDILPIIAKTSKIVVLEPEFPLFLAHYVNLYRLDSNNRLVEVRSEDLMDRETDYYLVSYIGSHGYVVTKKIRKDHCNLNDYKDFPNLNIQVLSTIHIDDLTGKE